jgi:hypothetical protein
MQTSKVGLVYVARRRLGTGNTAIWPGELVDVTGWKRYMIDIYIRQELIHPVPVLTDEQRAVIEQQWEAEEAGREARRLAAPEVEPEPPQPEPEPPLRWVACANCRERNAFDQPPADDDKFTCHFCGQTQSVMQARRNLLQLRDPRSIPVYDHGALVVNHARRNVDLTADFKAMLGAGVPEEGRANE